MRTKRALTSVAIVIWTLLSASAAPVWPGTPKLTVEQLSLRGIDALRLEVIPVSKDLREAGVSTEELEAAFAEEVRTSDIRIVSVPTVPVARLVVFGDTNDDQPDAVALTVVIALHQEILLKRVDVETTAPTAFFTETTLTTRARVRKKAEWEVREMARRMLKTAADATKRMQ